MYHDLVKGGDSPTVDPEDRSILSGAEFEIHLRAIRESCRCITVEEAVREIRHEGGLKENTVAITFDDGYASTYSVAFPLLKKYGLGATVYLPTDWINGKLRLWWEDLSDMMLGFEPDRASKEELEEICGELKIEPSSYMLNGKISRKMLHQVLSHELMKSSDDRKKKIMDDLRHTLFGGNSYKRRDVKSISWEQVSEMADAGIMFGAHTCSHINLSYVDIETAEAEIVESKREIERQLGREIKGFAYPYGYDVAGYARFIPLLEKIGFDYACTSWWGNNSGDSNLFQLLRNNVPPMKSKSLLKRELYIDLSE